MPFRIFSALWEQDHHIRVQLEAEYCTDQLQFSLEKEGKSTSYALEIISIHQDTHTISYTLKSPLSLDLEESYLIYDQDRNQAPLGYGSIVRSTVFDQTFAYDGHDLGVSYTSEHTTFKLWAPISKQVFLLINQESYPMKRADKGVWTLSLSGDWDSACYSYLHQVNGRWVECHDPYAVSSAANSGKSFVINPARLLQNKSRAKKQVPIHQAIIYEMSVRDFSWQKEAHFKHPGKFKGLTESPQQDGQTFGMDYIQSLGVTHIQLMPVYDFGSVDEQHPELVYNWGYDPVQYNVPEGSFASNPNNPYARILELQEAIEAYHRANISVIMDVVYNHVYDLAHSSFEKIVPGYCYRTDHEGNRSNGSFCGNDIASERAMIRRYIQDSLCHWVNLYNVDGFRFDLMGIIDQQTLKEAAQRLQELHPHLYLYGEGWKMPTCYPEEQLSHQYNAKELADFAFFSDDFRNTIKESLVHPETLTDPNFRKEMEQVLSANIGFHEPSHFLSPSQALNYIECHDNATIFDYLLIEQPEITLEERLQACRLGIQLVLLSQGIAFIHSGQEFFRSKNLIDNSYNSPDTINQLDWIRSLDYQADIHRIKELISLRKNHPCLSLSSAEEIKRSVHFHWLTDHVLSYQIKQAETSLTILINFSLSDYPLVKNLGGKMIYPQKEELPTLLPAQDVFIVEN